MHEDHTHVHTDDIGQSGERPGLYVRADGTVHTHADDGPALPGGGMHTHLDGTVHCHGEGGHPHVHTNKKAVIDRLSKAKGHLESVISMIDNDRDCAEVLVQIAAVRSAINNAGKVLLQDHIRECVTEAVEHNDQEEIEKLNKAIEQYIK